MKCSISKEQLIGHHYREMDADELKGMDVHLQECQSCREELESLSGASQILQAWPEENPDIKMVFMEEKVSPRSKVWDWAGATAGRRWSIAAAAVVAIVLMVFGALQYDRSFNRDQNVIAGAGDTAPEVLPERKNDPLARIYNQGIPTSSGTRQHAFAPHSEDKVLRDIDVMARIMDEAFDKRFQQYFERRGKTQGVYVNGLGPVFMVKDGKNNEFQDRDVNRVLRSLQGYQTTWQYSSPSPNVWVPRSRQDKIEDFPNALLEIVGEYGHTMRPLSPSESVVVAVEMDKGRIVSPNRSNRFLIKVKKKDIDAYNSGRIKMADFRKMVEVKEY